MAHAHVQSRGSRAEGAATTIALAFVSNVAAGNLIRIGVGWEGTTKTCTVADSLGNTYTSILKTSDTTDDQSSQIFYAKNIAGGACTVTATFSVSAAFRRLVMHESSGADTAAPLDGSNGQWEVTPGTGTDGCNSLAITPTANNALIWGFGQDTGGADPLVAGTGYTLRVGAGSGGFAIGEDRVQATAASIEATFTAGANNDVVSQVAAFKEAGVAAQPYIEILGERERPLYQY